MDLSAPTIDGRSTRIIDLDVVRGVALIGVCVLNYHGYLLNRGGALGHGWADRLMNPWTGPFSTRFAAMFVVVAGMGVSLLTRKGATSDHRWTLIRRGVLLFSFGFFLDWVWPGTILYFYGAYFMVAALVFTWRTRWLVALGTASALAAAGIQWWLIHQLQRGHDPSWLMLGPATHTRSPRDLVFDVFLRGTHPLLPWLAFLCAGMVLGRMLPFTSMRRVKLAFGGVLLAVTGYGLHAALPWHAHLRSVAPFDRGLLYVATTLGIAVVAVVVIGAVAERTHDTLVTQLLAVTGRTTLTLYVLHVLVFNLLVDWLGWVKPDGVRVSLLFGLLFWVGAIAFANAWDMWQSIGPLEWVYRRFSQSLPTRVDEPRDEHDGYRAPPPLPPR